MGRAEVVLGISAALSALAFAGERDAAACGGCFTPPTQIASDITDERMLLTVSGTQTTLYDQIKYVGSPTSFAWVLPIHGTVSVGLSADVLFDSIDALTATQIPQPPSSCPPQPCTRNGLNAASGPALGGAGTAAPAVTVLKQENVGPYATVQLHSTDASALNNWLAQNNFVIPPDVTTLIDQYVQEGFDFLALKLLPNQGVQSMRPVRVSAPGASLSLPLRMASVGTGAIVGITIWVVADGRYEPQNFPFFHIDDSALVWDWSTSLSNYTTLRVQNDALLKNAGWEIESSLTLNQQLITNVILSGGQYYGGRVGIGSQGVSDPSLDYLPQGNPDAGADGGGKTAEEVRTDDVNTLFAGISAPNVRITRMRGDISHAAMTVDLLLQASGDQSEISNVRTVARSVNEVCPVYNGCNTVGAAPSSSGGASGAGSASGAGAATGTSAGGPTTAATPRSQSGGCVASPQSTAGSTAGFGALAGVIGLAFARAIGARRRARRTLAN